MNISHILDESRRLLVERYVFPAVGGKIAALLADREAAGRYRDVTDAAELGKLVTDDLQSVNQDKHLRLRYHEEEVPDLPSEAMMLAMARRDADRSMNGVGGVELLEGNVAVLRLGLLFPPSISGEAVAAAMTLVATADALVLDLRECSGGDPDMVALVCSYLGASPCGGDTWIAGPVGSVARSDQGDLRQQVHR